jgi:hypothetical protein
MATWTFLLLNATLVAFAVFFLDYKSFLPLHLITWISSHQDISTQENGSTYTPVLPEYSELSVYKLAMLNNEEEEKDKFRGMCFQSYCSNRCDV